MLPLAASLLLLAASATADCPPGSTYNSDFNKCYQFVPTPKSFLDAEVYCNSLGGHLAEETNAFESSYIAGIANGTSSKTTKFWIGANALRSAKWTWTSNTPMDYTNWALGQPNGANPCAYVKDSDLTWVTLPCNTPLPFVCTSYPNATIPGTCPITPTPKPSLECSAAYCTNGYTLFSGTCLCYKYFNSTYLSYSDAEAACVKEGGMLPKIPSSDVNDFLFVLPGFQTWFADCPYIGLSCTSKDIKSCTWVDGTPVGKYSNFLFIQSNVYTLVANTELNRYDDGKWEYSEPSYKRAYYCQKAPNRHSSFNAAAARTNEATSEKKVWRLSNQIEV